MNSDGSQDRVVDRPSTFSAATYGARSAPGASSVIRRRLPAPSSTTRSNIGALTTRSAVPGIAGYSPMFAHTYQLLSEPRSSLPGRLEGVVSYISALRMTVVFPALC